VLLVVALRVAEDARNRKNINLVAERSQCGCGTVGHDRQLTKYRRSMRCCARSRGLSAESPGAAGKYDDVSHCIGSAHALQPFERDSELSTPVPLLNSNNVNEAAWKEPGVRFPVTCPMCARALLTELPVALIAEALIMGSSIRLHASCHDVYWDATELEVEQIREYLGAGVVTVQRRGS